MASENCSVRPPKSKARAARPILVESGENFGARTSLGLFPAIPKAFDIFGGMGNIFGEQLLGGRVRVGQLQTQVEITAVLSLNAIPGPVNDAPQVGNLPGLG